MSEVQNINIWNPETGIEDLPQDIDRLASQGMEQLRQQWLALRASIEGTEQLNTFTEQLAREWAIETGQIENLYHIERIVTLTLIEQGFSAAVLERGSTNKPRDYVLALINDQKDALDGLIDFVKQNRPLSTSYIKELHAAMTRSQTEVEGMDSAGNRVTRELLRGEYKQQPNFPERDGKRFNYCPPEQTASEMDKLVAMHLEHTARRVPAEVEAAWLHHRFTQIHPFMDGNGRVARALASLILIRAGMFPLVVPLDEKDSYLDALEAADEGDLRPLVMVVARRQQEELRKASVAISRQMPRN